MFWVLDEPTNDLDVETLDLLQELIGDYEGTVLMVSHDRDFLDRTATTTISMEGNSRATIYAGGWSDYRAQRGEAPLSATRSKPVASESLFSVTRRACADAESPHLWPQLHPAKTPRRLAIANGPRQRRDHQVGGVPGRTGPIFSGARKVCESERGVG